MSGDDVTLLMAIHLLQKIVWVIANNVTVRMVWSTEGKNQRKTPLAIRLMVRCRLMAVLLSVRFG